MARAAQQIRLDVLWESGDDKLLVRKAPCRGQGEVSVAGVHEIDGLPGEFELFDAGTGASGGPFVPALDGLDEGDHFLLDPGQPLAILHLDHGRQTGEHHAAFAGRVVQAPRVAQRLQHIVAKTEPQQLLEPIQIGHDIGPGTRLELLDDRQDCLQRGVDIQPAGQGDGCIGGDRRQIVRAERLVGDESEQSFGGAVDRQQRAADATLLVQTRYRR